MLYVPCTPHAYTHTAQPPCSVHIASIMLTLPYNFVRAYPSHTGCVDTSNKCKGNQFALCLEGCCCPVFSLSIARLHIMDKKRIRPDPCDYRIIACSNFLQLLSCVLDIVAHFVKELRDAAVILDCIADCFTLSAAGCMGAQIKHELSKEDVVVKVGGAPPVPNEMAR